MDISEELFSYSDKKYADFQAPLIPNLDKNTFIGVRIPILRKIAKRMYKDGSYKFFIISLPHKYYEENMLHALIISEIKDFDECISCLEAFFPYMDNWAVCDSLSPKVFKNNKEKLKKLALDWLNSNLEYKCRFGIKTLMSHFSEEAFSKDFLEIVASIDREEYYIKMMVAWYFATLLAKQWEEAIKYIEEKRLPKWTHNKAIQKAIESYRIPGDKKTYLRSLKVK